MCTTHTTREGEGEGEEEGERERERVLVTGENSSFEISPPWT